MTALAVICVTTHVRIETHFEIIIFFKIIILFGFFGSAIILAISRVFSGEGAFALSITGTNQF
jgi:hypothetical protein